MTITAAIVAASGGQTVCVHSGVYTETVTIPAAKTGLSLVAYPGESESPVISGDKRLPGTGRPEDRFKSLVELNAANSVFDGFEVAFSAARGVDVTASGVVVRNSSIHDNWSTGINVRNSVPLSGVVIEDNQVYNNIRRAQHAPVIYKGTRVGSGPTDWTFDPDTYWDNPFWTGANLDLPEQWVNDFSMTFAMDGTTSRIYVGSARAGRVGYISSPYSTNGEISYSGADILFHADNKWTLYFDGEQWGVTADNPTGNDEVIDAFQIESTASEQCPACLPMLMSFTETVNIPIQEGITVTNTAIGQSDLVRFTPTGIGSPRGEITGGYFTLYKRAADFGGLPQGANIDALDRAPDGRLLMSFTDSQTLINPDNSPVSVQKEDLVAYDETTGFWTVFFNGNDIPYNPFNAEDLTAAWLDGNGNIYISGDAIGGSALTFIYTTGATARGNSVYNNYGEGLVADRFSQNTTLEDNVLYDNQHANLYLNSTQNPLVRRNLVFCTDDQRFWRKGSLRTYRPGPGIQIRDETFEGAMPPTSSGQVIINNIVIGCSTNFGVSTQTPNGGLNNALVANNTFANARGQLGGQGNGGIINVELNGGASYTNSFFVNNLILQKTTGAIVSGSGTNLQALTVANNFYSTNPPAQWFTSESGRVVGSNPQLVDPQLADTPPPLPVMNQIPDPDDYRLTYESAALDAGQAQAQVSEDYFGQSRAGSGPLDIGADELPHTGGIVVIQETSPAEDTQAFDFTADFAPTSFTLSGGQQQASGALQAGTYSVSSAPVEGWTTTATCDDGSQANAIILGPNETVTCTFHSQRQTRLIVSNTVEPADDPQQFDFTLDGGAPFALSGGDTNTLSVTPNVAYSLAVTVPDGWQQTLATCDNGDTPDVVTLDPGEWVTCSFTHRKMSRIIIEKQTLPDGAAQAFDFTADYGAFQLSDGQQNTSAYLTPGTYSVAEALPSGWVQTTATCDDGSSPNAIGLASGETVTCVFTNGQLGLSLTKTPAPASVTAPGGDVSFAVHVSNSGGAALSLTGLSDSVFGNVANSGNTALVSTTCSLPRNLSPGGEYDCAFIAHVGGAGSSTHSNTLTANGSGPGGTSVSASATATVNILNAPAGRIIVTKVTDPANTPGTFNFTASYDADGFSLSHGQSNDSGPLPSGVTYSVAETVPAGWSLASAVCSGDDDGSNPASIILDPNETVTCTFTNARTTTAPPVTFYISPTKAGTVRGLAYALGDILAYNGLTDTWTLYFDASDVGLTKPLSDFVLLDDGSILMAINGKVKLRNAAGALFTQELQDVARFVPSSLGATTAGAFEVYFDGSDVGLSASGEKIDALARKPDGTLLISPTGAASVKKGGATIKAADEDLLAFAPGSLGANTSGVWSLAFDGSTLAGMAVEDVTAVWYDAATGDLYLTITNNFTVGGVAGTSRTVLAVTPARAVSKYWDAATAGYGGNVDGLHIVR